MVTHPDQSPHIVLVVQFRPATGQYTIEWPSGLIDQKEGVGEAALRELKEETGYVGQVVSISPPMTNEPGMSSSRCCIVEVDVDGTLPENQKLQSQREEDEWSLQTITLPLDNLLEGLLELSKYYQPKLTVDARLYNYAAGLAAGRRSIRRN
ncbi:hypothetical protein IWQ60_003249 [Tieghemiomyces parasiticus]|uniref:Nudix hydrolase domain-containing protein n=1 Tax=Tieghemiomyces parasiticus TaxID=78921 RepID=A0A9W8AAK4_9FUNG|nr:hypothetical protein IWQ60_003249 [Tieghemiomyces parasiticus]